MVLGKLDSQMQKNETGQYLTPYSKMNSNCIKDLNSRPEAIKVWEENTGASCLWHWSQQWFFWIWHQQHRQQKKNKWDCTHQTKKLLHSKGNHQENEKAIYGMGENICKPHIWWEINIQNIHELIQLNNKNPNNPIKNEQRIWIDIFFLKTYKWPTGTWKCTQHH